MDNLTDTSNMIKYLILAVITYTFLAVSILNKPEVYMQINAPSVTDAGSTVDVEIELYKDQITGFARFQQELPYGVTASPVYPADMNFYFEDNTVKMIWLNLPPEDKITIRYQLQVYERLKGDIILDGTFSYIDNNQRRSTSAPGSKLAINPSSKFEERFIVDVSEANQKLLPPPPSADGSGDIFAIRQNPVLDNDLGYFVNILVNKAGKNHFAKIEEVIPEGFTAVEMESHGGIFSFSDQKARIIWKSLPAENNFVASYRLIPDDGINSTPEVRGEFSFMHNDITANRIIIQKDTDLSNLNEDDRNTFIASLTTENNKHTGMPAKEVAASAPAGKTASAGSYAKTSRPLPSKQGINYRVQLAAGHKSVDVKQYFSRLNITDEVSTEMHEGWIKYSIGSFNDYKSARDQREHVWNTTPINDAFVAAYNGVTRITVQEALMVANHQWYR